MPCSIGTDRGVQMDQMAMARQLGAPRALRLKSFLAEAFADCLHDQLMFVAVLARLHQGVAAFASTSSAGQGIAAQPPASQGEQPLWLGSKKSIVDSSLPEEAAAPGLLMPQPLQQR